MAEKAAIQKAYDAWSEHTNRPRMESELAVLRILQNAFPDSHVTLTKTAKCDLLAFAAAGNAVATPNTECDIVHDAIRVYKAPGSRHEKKPAKLQDNVKFGRWSYEWQDHDFVVYEMNYEDRYLRAVKNLFVVAPLSKEAIVGGHHKATDALLMASGEWTRELHEEIYVFDSAQWTKNKELWKSVQNASWDDVILDPTMKAKLIDDVQGFFDNQELYQTMNIPWKRGVIFHGVPGNGKTISVKALINSLAKRPQPVQSLYVKSLDSCQGLKWSIQEIFKHARLMAPCLLIFEDLDSLVEDKTRGYFLNEVDGLELNDGILMIGSTNHIDQIDPAITKRPSRFDRKYHFKIPSEEERIAYCRYWCRKFANSTAVDFPDEICPLVAKFTADYSFAYLKELFVTSLLILARGGEEPDEVEAPRNESNRSVTNSNSDAVLVENSVSGDGDKKNPEGENKEPAKKKKARSMPEVDTPEHLQDNKFLMIIKSQAKLLLEEMDHATEEAGKRNPACAPDPFSPAMMARFMESNDN